MSQHQVVSLSEKLKNILHESRIESSRAYLNNKTGTTQESDGLNPMVGVDVTYQKVIPTISRVLSKYENRGERTGDIALYDLRNHDLYGGDIPELGNNKILKMIQESSKTRIIRKNTDLMPQIDNYNPMLPDSETNKPVYSGLNLDERMQYHIQDRPFNYKSDQNQIANDLDRSQEMQRRRDLQHQADDSLFGRVKRPRWVEPMLAYNTRYHLPQYIMEEQIERTTPHPGFDIRTAYSDDALNIKSYDNSEQFESGLERNPSANDMTSRQFTDTSEKQSSLVYFFEKIKKILKTPIAFSHSEMFEDKEPDVSHTMINFRDTGRRMEISNGIRNGQIGEFKEEAATAYIGELDKRIMVVKNNDVIRILTQNNLFENERRPWGEDTMYIDVPVSHLTTRLKKKLIENKTERGIMKLDRDDFIDITDFVVSNQDKQQRLHVDRSKTRQLNDFDGQEIVLDEQVYKNNAGMRHPEYNDILRRNKIQYGLTDNIYSTFNNEFEKNTINVSASDRSRGLVRGRFDGFH